MAFMLYKMSLQLISSVADLEFSKSGALYFASDSQWFISDMISRFISLL
jgi:hypothetical protein